MTAENQCRCQIRALAGPGGVVAEPQPAPAGGNRRVEVGRIVRVFVAQPQRIAQIHQPARVPGIVGSRPPVQLDRPFDVDGGAGQPVAHGVRVAEAAQRTRIGRPALPEGDRLIEVAGRARQRVPVLEQAADEGGVFVGQQCDGGVDGEAERRRIVAGRVDGPQHVGEQDEPARTVGMTGWRAPQRCTGRIEPGGRLAPGQSDRGQTGQKQRPLRIGVDGPLRLLQRRVEVGPVPGGVEAGQQHDRLVQRDGRPCLAGRRERCPAVHLQGPIEVATHAGLRVQQPQRVAEVHQGRDGIGAQLRRAFTRRDGLLDVGPVAAAFVSHQVRVTQVRQHIGKRFGRLRQRVDRLGECVGVVGPLEMGQHRGPDPCPARRIGPVDMAATDLTGDRHRIVFDHGAEQSDRDTQILLARTLGQRVPAMPVQPGQGPNNTGLHTPVGCQREVTQAQGLGRGGVVEHRGGVTGLVGPDPRVEGGNERRKLVHGRHTLRRRTDRGCDAVMTDEAGRDHRLVLHLLN